EAFPWFFFTTTDQKESTMAEAKQGDTVQLHYMGKLPDGTIFDSSRERRPLQFTIGNGQVIAGFEQAVVGMKVGDLKTARIPMEQAYGPRRDDLVVTMDRSKLPPGLNPKVGQRLEMTQVDDQTSLVTVTGATESTLTLDANHPLAGKELTFDIELVGIL
ncbi:MAG: peptidylprolyl isomerase, partial [Nitrospirota bacterium]